MSRPLTITAAALFLGLSVGSGRASAQLAPTGVTSDPFSFYYGYYLPHQAYIAAQPRALDSINQVVATRQYQAQTDRAALYDPISPYGGEDESDPFKPYNGQKGGGQRAGGPSYSYGGGSNSNANGSGPSVYYGRTARYFPTLRTGRGSNRNVATMRSPRGGAGMPGMPSMPSAGGVGIR